jgi:hypothetical protein
MERCSYPSLPSAVGTAALVLHVDSVTSEVVTAMRGAGIRTLLLKGPSIAAWLYGEDAARPYDDSDLLVAPSSYRQAGDVLRQLGFRPRAYSLHRDSQAWLRRRDTSYVDLHRSLIGVLAPADVVWSELATGTETLRVGGIDVDVLRVPARALHVALHAAQHGGVGFRRPVEDLARALRVVHGDDWREAADLARRLDALPAFAAGLRLETEGVMLAERLNLPDERTPAVELRAGSYVPVAVALDSLASERSLRARARILFGAVVPSRLYMRHWSSLHITGWPAALRQGPLGLALAYLWRPVWILMRLPKAIAALRRARRDQGEAER